jgi:hypothetical protein
VTPVELDTCFALRQAAKILPGNPSRSTLSRWVHHGVRGVRLETVLVGGRRYTTRAAIDEFLVALSRQESNGDAA